MGCVRAGTALGDNVYSYGNSELRLGLSQLSPKRGVSLGDGAGGWTHTVYTVTPGIPGDSGSGFLNASGQAIGILSTLELAPTPAANAPTTTTRIRRWIAPKPPWRESAPLAETRRLIAHDPASKGDSQTTRVARGRGRQTHRAAVGASPGGPRRPRSTSPRNT